MSRADAVVEGVEPTEVEAAYAERDANAAKKSSLIYTRWSERACVRP